MSGAPAKHREWLNRVAEWLEEEEGREVLATELPRVIRRKDGRPYRNKPQPRAVFKRVQADPRFEVDYDGEKSHRKVVVRLKRRDD